MHHEALLCLIADMEAELRQLRAQARAVQVEAEQLRKVLANEPESERKGDLFSTTTAVILRLRKERDEASGLAVLRNGETSK